MFIIGPATIGMISNLKYISIFLEKYILNKRCMVLSDNLGC